jgi:hypothetical protein
MTRGNLVIYDLEGTIISQSGEMQSNADIAPHKYPVGIPYIELPYGSMKWEEQQLIKIDVKTEPHSPIFEKIDRVPTSQETIETLENELLIAKGVI